jgi:hypothetical protein
VYESLLDYRNELRNIFGVRGSTAQGTISDKTVRGKMQIKGQDSDRIGGGISTYLEQFADFVYNYVVQMMYVYYDEEHTGELIGQSHAVEYVKLKSADFVAKLSVSVKDGSMIPKDPVSAREEVITLWEMQAIDPITFFEKLDFPDPKKSAEQLTAWKIDPLILFPELKKALGQPPLDPAQQAQADKLKQQMALEGQKGQVDLQSKGQQNQIATQKGEADLVAQDHKAQIEVQKAILDIQHQKEMNALEIEKVKQGMEQAKQASEAKAKMVETQNKNKPKPNVNSNNKK